MKDTLRTMEIITGLFQVFSLILIKDRALCSFGFILGDGQLNEVWADCSQTDLGMKSPVHGRHSVNYVWK